MVRLTRSPSRLLSNSSNAILLIQRRGTVPRRRRTYQRVLEQRGRAPASLAEPTVLRRLWSYSIRHEHMGAADPSCPAGVSWLMALARCTGIGMKRVAWVVAYFATTLPVRADDWGMGEANRKIPQTNIFTTVSTPGDEVNTVALFVLAVTGVIFVVVGGLLAYSVVRFRAVRATMVASRRRSTAAIRSSSPGRRCRSSSSSSSS